MNEITFEQLPKAVSELLNMVGNIEKRLSTAENHAETDHPLTIEQAGEYIKLSRGTIYGLVSSNKIPFSKQGKRLYFSKKDLTDWIKEGKRKTITEIENDASLSIKSKKK
ncbi:MAG: helix-turn-helix domain-containing protein [Bacteroidota bacterium]